MLDIEVRQFREDLIDFVNQAQIPLEVKRLVLNEVYRAVAEASDDFINKQKQSIIDQLNDPNNTPVQAEIIEDDPIPTDN